MIHTSVLSPKIVGVAVEYTSGANRLVKCFKTNAQARSFYIKQSAAGNEPKIIAACTK